MKFLITNDDIHRNEREDYTNKLEDILSSTSQECRQKIFNQWEKEVFPYSDEVKKYLQYVYDKTATQNNT